MAQKKTKTGEVLYLGIDLGTSRSVVCASNGKREWVHSYVGWPKDFVAKKALLGRDILFGAEALDHRLSLNLHRPLEGGVLKEGTERDEQAVSGLVGHLIELAGAGDDDLLRVAVGVPAECLKVNKLAIRNAVGQHADQLMVVSEPFAVAYGLEALDNAMIIDIGAGTVDFCIMHGTVPGEEDQRSLLNAGDSIDAHLLKLMKESIPEAGVTLNMARQFKETLGFVGAPAKAVEVQLPVEGKMVTYDITEEMQKACESILPGIVETTRDLIASFDPEYQARVRGNIILAGGGSQVSGIAEYLTNAMRDFELCTFTCVDDPLYAGAAGGLDLAKDMPEELMENL
jgi:rod shape-determining protein MreB